MVLPESPRVGQSNNCPVPNVYDVVPRVRRINRTNQLTTVIPLRQVITKKFMGSTSNDKVLIFLKQNIMIYSIERISQGEQYFAKVCHVRNLCLVLWMNFVDIQTEISLKANICADNLKDGFLMLFQ